MGEKDRDELQEANAIAVSCRGFFKVGAGLGAIEAWGAFFFSWGVTITGGEVIHKYV